MIYYKTTEEIELLRESSLLVSRTLAEVAKVVKPGVSLLKLDSIAEEYIRDHGARPAFKDYPAGSPGVPAFPGSLCLSLNEMVVHGLPTNYELKETDIISVDCGVELNGYYGDSAYTLPLAGVSQEVIDLCRTTKTSLFLAIEQSVAGKQIGDIGFAVQDYCERKKNYGIVRELVGHGVGRDLHEAPEVPNYGKRGSGKKLQQGLVIAIEPMVNMGKRNVAQLPDGWTIVTADRKPSAHYELMVAVQKGQADILSTFEYVEAACKNNNDLIDIQVFEEDLINK